MTDAARHVWNGNSPYARHTYRYTPFAAYLCVFNVFLHPDAGKIIYSVADIVMGLVLWKLIESQNENKTNTYIYVSFWLYNPVTIMCSTRGSNDNLIVLLVFTTLYYLIHQ